MSESVLLKDGPVAEKVRQLENWLANVETVVDHLCKVTGKKNLMDTFLDIVKDHGADVQECEGLVAKSGKISGHAVVIKAEDVALNSDELVEKIKAASDDVVTDVGEPEGNQD